MTGWQCLLNQPDAFNGFLGRADILLITGTHRKHQWVKNDIFSIQTILVNEQIMRAFGNFQLIFSRNSLSPFIDGTYDHSCTILMDKRSYIFKLLFAVLKVNGVNY
ncbi:hypothetical protein D3C73_1413200 [compost metagenome]